MGPGSYGLLYRRKHPNGVIWTQRTPINRHGNLRNSGRFISRRKFAMLRPSTCFICLFFPLWNEFCQLKNQRRCWVLLEQRKGNISTSMIDMNDDVLRSLTSGGWGTIAWRDDVAFGELQGVRVKLPVGTHQLAVLVVVVVTAEAAHFTTVQVSNLKTRNQMKRSEQREK